MECSIIMRLTSWNHSRGSKTVTYHIKFRERLTLAVLWLWVTVILLWCMIEKEGHGEVYKEVGKCNLSPHFRNINCGHTNRWRKCGVKSCGSSKLNFRTSSTLSRIPTNLNPAESCRSSEIQFWRSTIAVPQLFFSLQFHNRLRKCGYAVTEQHFF